MDDLVMGYQGDIRIEINKEIYNGLETAWLKLNFGDRGGYRGEIDWVAVPREYEEDLVLFRRQQQPGDKGKSLYIPQCENLYAFDVNMLDPNGDPADDPNASTLIEVWAQMYRMCDRDPDRGVYARGRSRPPASRRSR